MDAIRKAESELKADGIEFELLTLATYRPHDDPMLAGIWLSHAGKQKALKERAFIFTTVSKLYCNAWSGFSNLYCTFRTMLSRFKTSQAPKFFDAKSQFAMFQNASMNFGRALR